MRVEVITINGARQYQCTDELTGQVTTIEITDDNLKELADKLIKAKLKEFKAERMDASFPNVNPIMVNNLIKISKAIDEECIKFHHHANNKTEGITSIVDDEMEIKKLILDLIESFSTHDADIISAKMNLVGDALIKLNDKVAAFNKVNVNLDSILATFKSRLSQMEERVNKIDAVKSLQAHTSFNALLQKSKQIYKNLEEHNKQIKEIFQIQEQTHKWNWSTYKKIEAAITAHNEKLTAKATTAPTPQSSTAVIYAQQLQTSTKTLVAQDQSPSALSIHTATTVVYPSRRDSYSSTPPQFMLRSGTPSPSKKIAPEEQIVQQPAPNKSCCSLM